MTRSFVAIVAGILVLLTGLLALLWAAQRRLMYFPLGPVYAPGEVGLQAEAVEFPTEDGLTLRGWWVAGRQKPAPFTVIVFNGNGGNRSYRAPLAAALQAHGFSVLLFDYRGYGGNRGTPTEEGLAADARAALAYVRGRPDVDAGRLVYFGESLGTAVAVRLAASEAPAALVLRSPFTSMVDVGQHHYPALPVRWLLRDRYASIDRMRQVHCPVLVVAGGRDSIVPIELSQRLFDAALPSKQFVVEPDADHNDVALLSGSRLIDAMVSFVQSER